MSGSRLKVGVDVPWVTAWTGEAIIGVGPCESVEGLLAVRQAHRPGSGRPCYAENRFRRQQDSVQQLLCPMCGGPTP